MLSNYYSELINILITKQKKYNIDCSFFLNNKFNIYFSTNKFKKNQVIFSLDEMFLWNEKFYKDILINTKNVLKNIVLFEEMKLILFKTVKGKLINQKQNKYYILLPNNFLGILTTTEQHNINDDIYVFVKKIVIKNNTKFYILERESDQFITGLFEENIDDIKKKKLKILKLYKFKDSNNFFKLLVLIEGDIKKLISFNNIKLLNIKKNLNVSFIYIFSKGEELKDQLLKFFKCKKVFLKANLCIIYNSQLNIKNLNYNLSILSDFLNIKIKNDGDKQINLKQTKYKFHRRKC